MYAITDLTARLQAEEDSATIDCGCVLRRNSEDGTPELWFCALHAAAPRLVEALRKAERAARYALAYAGEVYSGSVESDLAAVANEARALLAEIEKED